MQYQENCIVYIAAQTADGFRYLYYTTADYDKLGDGTYIHHGLGASLKDGSWQTVIRDLEYDLKEAQPDNSLLSIDAFLIRGSGRVDDIKVYHSIPAQQDSDHDGISVNRFNCSRLPADDLPTHVILKRCLPGC